MRDIQETLTTTARVLVTPSEMAKKKAAQAIGKFPIEPIIRDLAAICARELANEWEGMGLRAADHADIPDVAKKVVKRLIDALAEIPEDFAVPLGEYLRLRG